MSAAETDEIIRRLVNFAYARDRSIDREPREVVLTDDEAAAIAVRLGFGPMS